MSPSLAKAIVLDDRRVLDPHITHMLEMHRNTLVATATRVMQKIQTPPSRRILWNPFSSTKVPFYISGFQFWSCSCNNLRKVSTCISSFSTRSEALYSDHLLTCSIIGRMSNDWYLSHNLPIFAAV